MRQTIIYSFCLAATSFYANAQFLSGPEGFVIMNETQIVIDSLTLRPTAGALGIINNSLTHSATPIPGNPNGSIQRVYTFSVPLTFTGEAGIIFNSDELNGNTEANLEISFSDSAEGAFTISNGSTFNEEPFRVFNTLTGQALSSVTAADQEGSLPVNLVDFIVRKEGQTALLTWSTSAETNSEYFEVQRSQNAKKWESAGKVAAKGENRQLHAYSFTDEKPLLNGNNFYRLKMVDRDNTFAYSAIRQISFDGTMPEVTLYPNPTAEKLMIKLSDWSKISNVQITNLLGNVVYDAQVGKILKGASAEVDMQSLPSGAYVIKINHINGGSNTFKIIRQ